MNKIVMGFIILFCVSCKLEKMPIIVDNDKTTYLFGEVFSIEGAKDGYIASINDKNKGFHKALINITNLEKRNNFKVLKKGELVALKGESWNLAGDKRFTTRKILTNNYKEFKLKGVITDIKFGKDGYQANLISKGIVYQIMISIPNLGKNHKKYKVFEKGEKVYLQGELWVMGKRLQVTVRDIF